MNRSKSTSHLRKERGGGVDQLFETANTSLKTSHKNVSQGEEGSRNAKISVTYYSNAVLGSSI